ncbi:T9SS type A sorting domain-containing protein [Schleiferia thermophila]|uniref:Putative secreted protein (Por secretion system target) n=1 Tax=Schleiferia thermophila TaxID=884107 RepID=A0A369A716_9FLAO|nr:T9SS type A sorting domain-containing protein [Schleiferia thermophila]RCX05142.1 putative secreted protein (Por secretion system target) [Schleiferia thermophila]
MIVDNSHVITYTDVLIEETGFIQLINSSTLFTVNSPVTLRANATNYAKLLVCGSCTLSGSSNIVKETYFAAGAANTNMASPDFNDGKNGRWYSIGMPMPGVAMNSFDGGSPAFFSSATPGPIARWDANTGNYVYPTNLLTDNFIAGQGYVIYMGENQHGIITRDLSTQNLISLTMDVANPSATISLGYTNSPLLTNIFGSNTDGWNLVVNPCLAPLNLQGTSTVNADATAYIYNPTTGNFTTFNFSDPSPFFIAPLQAFWVRATTTGGSISVLPANQSTSANPAQAKPQIQMEHAWLKLVRQDGSEDLLKIYFRQEATDGYENTYDSEKLTGDPTRIGLFSTASGKPTAVDSRSPVTGHKQIPVYVYCGSFSVLTISIESLNLPSGYKAWLEDHITNQMVEIENGPYTFYQSFIGNHHRFTLHIAESMIGVNEQVKSYDSQVWTSGTNLHILLSATTNSGDFSLFDMSGKCIYTKKFEGIAGQHLTFDLSHLRSGVYVVRTRINGLEKSIKFIR